MARRYLAFASRLTTLAATFILSLAFIFLIFPHVDLGDQMLDMRWRQGYTLDDVMTAMAHYGDRGRRLYMLSSTTLDALFPACYVTFMCGLIYRLLPDKRFGLLALAPMAAGLFDLCENALIVTMLLQYPRIPEGVVRVASAFTMGKVIVNMPNNVLMAGTGLWRLGAWVASRTRSPSR